MNIFLIQRLLLGECVISLVLSRHNKNSKWRTSITALGQTVSQLSDRSSVKLLVPAQFYLENKGKYILEAWGHADPKDAKRRKREREKESKRARDRETPAPWLLFLCFFLLRLDLPCVNRASQEFCLFYLWSSFRSLELPFVLFLWAFPFFVF